LIRIKADGLPMVVGNQKTMANCHASEQGREAIWNLIHGHGVPAIQKNSAIKENVWLV
jgi:hypothetical protein